MSQHPCRGSSYRDGQDVMPVVAHIGVFWLVRLRLEYRVQRVGEKINPQMRDRRSVACAGRSMASDYPAVRDPPIQIALS
jgi:hypothetical protein